jgi:SEC-C motif-containing protein
MKATEKSFCPCGKTVSYLACCGRFIVDHQLPETAEELMRSRYTAYTLAEIDYIQATMALVAAEDFDPLSAKTWAKSVKWKRLKVLRHDFDIATPNVAYVEFIAHYIHAGRAEQLREYSEFKKINGRWFYTGQK